MAEWWATTKTAKINFISTLWRRIVTFCFFRALYKYTYLLTYLLTYKGHGYNKQFLLYKRPLNKIKLIFAVSLVSLCHGPYTLL